MFYPSAKILADSMSASGHRLTTLQVIGHRFILAEFNTHRAFCLSGDSVLEFDLPGGTTLDYRRTFTMSLSEFADKWYSGAAPRANKPRKTLPLHLVVPECVYTGAELVELLGTGKGNLHGLCRSGALKASKGPKRSDPWMIRGEDFLSYWTTPGTNSQPIRERLKAMRIRQVDENTGRVHTSTVVDVILSGEKHVSRVSLSSGEEIKATSEHRILTDAGWLTVGALSVGSKVAVRRFGKQEKDKTDSLRWKKIDGRWRSIWQRQKAIELRAEDPLCRQCRSEPATDVAHLVAVHEDPSKTFDDDNVTFLCESCHQDLDRIQGWQGGTYLYAGYADVVSIVDAGVEMTYDLEIAGEFPNFLANGVVVHNSRNSASSRAIPYAKMRQKVLDELAYPVSWPAEQKGMQGGEPVSVDAETDAINEWTEAAQCAVDHADALVELGVHKSVVNRLLEPFLSHTIIISATDWAGFWEQRCHPDAQPEIHALADEMKKVYNASKPIEMEVGDWHLPLIQEDERDLPIHDLKLISAARCARVSYLQHSGVRDISLDLDLADRLTKGMHWSPFEHVATPGSLRSPGNFTGWRQFRHEVETWTRE